MPTNGGGEFSPEALAHRAAYWTDRRRLREASAEYRASQRAARERERAALRERARSERDRRSWAREYVAGIRADQQERREKLRTERDGIRADPLYALYRQWGRRIDNDVVYDRAAWRRGRLVPVLAHMRYQGGGRREVVDWTEILDRDAQELGTNVQDLPRRFDRLRQAEARLHRLAREEDEERRKDSDAIAAARGA